MKERKEAIGLDDLRFMAEPGVLTYRTVSTGPAGSGLNCVGLGEPIKMCLTP